MTVSGRKHNADDIIATILAVEPMKFIYRGRIAVFSIRVLRDERICVIAEQRPECSEEEVTDNYFVLCLLYTVSRCLSWNNLTVRRVSNGCPECFKQLTPSIKLAYTVWLSYRPTVYRKRLSVVFICLNANVVSSRAICIRQMCWYARTRASLTYRNRVRYTQV